MAHVEPDDAREELHEQSTLKAWRIVYSGIPDEVGIWIATSRQQAMAKAQCHLNGIGYNSAYIDFRCIRAPEYDEWARRQELHRQNVGIGEEWVKKEVEGKSWKGKTS